MFKTVNGGKLPTRGTKYSACVDLYANEDVVIGAGETKVIGLGVKVDINEFVSENQSMFMEQDQMFTFDSVPEYTFSSERLGDFLSSHYLQLSPRSSLRAEGLISGQGYIDLDYHDEIKLIVHNPIISENFNSNLSEFGSDNDAFIDTSFTIKKGDKIAQITLLEHKSYLFGIDSEDERTGGIGSTN